VNRYLLVIHALDAVGLALLTVGFGLFSIPLSLIMLGLGLIVFARSVERGRPAE
jgi:hypothetical protein